MKNQPDLVDHSEKDLPGLDPGSLLVESLAQILDLLTVHLREIRVLPHGR